MSFDLQQNDTQNTKKNTSYQQIIQNTIDILETGISFRNTPEANATESSTKQANTKQTSIHTSSGMDASNNISSGTHTIKTLEQLEAQVKSCQKCKLCTTRKYAVPGMGVQNPLVMVVGEGPGQHEDLQGLPFVGTSGMYLDKWLMAIGLSRKDNAYITNVVKCRPPQNRDPEQDEIDACNEYLFAQINILKPKVILCVGRIASYILTGQSNGKKTNQRQINMSELRKKVYSYHNIPLFVTYHPSAVLRNPNTLRQPVWEDLQNLKRTLDSLQ